MDFFLSTTPVLFVAVLILVFRRGVIFTGAAGLVFTSLLVYYGFGTSSKVVLLSSVDGVLTTLPLILVVYGGILLADILVSTGYLRKLGRALTGSAGGKGKASLILSFGLGNALEGAGIVAEPLTAPLFRSAGFSPEESAALSMWGYSGFLTLEFAGIIMTVLSLATDIPIEDLLLPVSAYSMCGGTLLALLLPFIIRSHRWSLKDFLLIGLTLISSGAAIAVSVAYLSYKFSGPLMGIAVFAALTLAHRLEKKPVRAARDKESLEGTGVFGILFAVFLLFNLTPPLKNFLSEHLTLITHVIPNHMIKFNPLLDVYTYLFLAGYLTLPREKNRPEKYMRLLRENLGRGGRAAVAMALFGAMGQVISLSGFVSDFSMIARSHDLSYILASGMFDLTGKFYLLFVPLLGWVGTFLTGYGVASIMLFGKLQASAAHLLGLPPPTVVAMLAVGASVGSISSPFKIAIATPLCDAQGKEPDILRKTIPAGILVCLLLGVVLYLTG